MFNPLRACMNLFQKGLKVFLGLFRIVFYITIVLAVVFVVLGNIGGNSDNLKTVIEKYASDATGYTARVTTLNRLAFFPTIVVDFDGLTFEDPKRENTLVASVGHVDVRMGFFDTVLRNGQIKSLDVMNVDVQKDVVLSKSIKINAITIKDDNQQSDEAAITLDGMVGDDKLNAAIGLGVKGDSTARTYGLGDKRHVSLKYANYTLDLDMAGGGFGDTELNNIIVKQDAQKVLVSGDVRLGSTLSGLLIKGDLSVGEASQVKPDITIAQSGAVKGDIVFPQIEPNEFAAIMGALGAVQSNFSPAGAKVAQGIDLSGLNLDLDLDVQKLLMNGHAIGAQKVKVLAENGSLRISAKDGTFADGKTDLSVTVNPRVSDSAAAEKLPLHDLKIDFSMDEMDVASLLKANNQKTDMIVHVDGAVNLKAALRDWSEVQKNLDGTITLATQDGRFESRWLSVWGDGLASLLLPSLKPSDEAKLNCGVINIKAHDGVAAFDTMYLDGQHVRVLGEGHYNIVSDKLDMKIKPYTKGVSIGDISAAVKIKGPLSKPSVKPDVVDTSKKAAGLLLGAVNPAFLAIGSTNLGDVVTSTLGDAVGVKLNEKIPDLCPVVAQLPAGNKAEAFAKEAAKSPVAQ